MKKTFLFASIVVLSITTQAENSPALEYAMGKRQENISDPAQIMFSNSKQVIPPENRGNDSNLWKMLDTDYDGFLSKTEAASSKDVFDNWDKLDINKDQKLDSEEFVKVFYQEN